MVILSMMNQRNYFRPHSLIEGGEDGERELTRKNDCSVLTAPKVKRYRKKVKINSAVTSPSIKHTHTHAPTHARVHTYTHTSTLNAVPLSLLFLLLPLFSFKLD